MTTQNEAPERSLGQLVADATHDITSIVHSEIALAKAEIGADAKRAGLGAGVFVVAGVLAFLALILLLFSAVYGLVAAGLAQWLSFLIVAGVLLLVCVILGLVGVASFKRLNGKPERTIKNAQDTMAAIKPRST
jgi:amino acid transporter